MKLPPFDYACPTTLPEAVQLLAQLIAELRVRHAQTLGRRQAQHAELALVHVVMHLVRGLARLLEREHL